MGSGGLGPVDGEWSGVSTQTGESHPGLTAEPRWLQEACGEELGAGEAGFPGTSPDGHHGHCGRPSSSSGSFGHPPEWVV